MFSVPWPSKNPFWIFCHKHSKATTFWLFTILVIRLDGGSNNAGRIEIYYNGTWGTVCDDDWDMNDARVVCRQLGFSYVLGAYQSSHYGQRTILLGDVNCFGNESSLFSCRHAGVGNHTCSHSGDASVQCGSTGGEIKIIAKNKLCI